MDIAFYSFFFNPRQVQLSMHFNIMLLYQGTRGTEKRVRVGKGEGQEDL